MVGTTWKLIKGCRLFTSELRQAEAPEWLTGPPPIQHLRSCLQARRFVSLAMLDLMNESGRRL